MVPEVGLCASRAVGLRSAQRLCRSGAPRPLQKPHRGFCDTGLRVPDRKTKTAPWGRFFVLVPEVGLCASRAVGLRSAQRLCRSGAPRPLQKPHRGFCDTGLRVPDRKTKTAPWGRFFVLVPEVGLEPTRGISPADFEFLPPLLIHWFA